MSGLKSDNYPDNGGTLKVVDKTTKNQPSTEATIEGARRARDAVDRERKRRRREDRRRLVVKWIVGFSAFVGINGSFIILANLSGIIGLLFDEWRPIVPITRWI